MKLSKLARRAVAAVGLLALVAVAGNAAPLQKRIFVASAPSVLLVTNYYTYGVAPFGNDPESKLWVDPNGFSQAVAPYLYHYDRVTGDALWFHLNEDTGTLEVLNAETPLFGDAGDPVLIPAPDVAELDLFGPNSTFGTYPAGLPRATGHYMLVFELRDSSNQVVARDNAMFSFIDSVITMTGGDISTQTFTPNNAYLLTGQVYIPNGATLTIQPGTVVLGSQGVVNSLGTKQGGTLLADCENLLPCRFTSNQERPNRRTGDFGGLNMNGFGVTNLGTSPPPEGEGDTGPYGGDNPADNSGILSYVIVEFAGFNFTPDNQLNSIAMQGVGTGTQVDHIQCTNGQDDGIEFFGGNVNADYYIGLNNEDDTLDWTSGWDGTVNKACAIQTSFPPGSIELANDHCIEADNDEDDNDLLPRSNPTINRFTCVALKANGTDGMRIRRGTGVQGTKWNGIGMGTFGIRVDDQATLDLIGQAGGVNIDAIIEDADSGASNVAIPGVGAGSVFIPNGSSQVQPQVVPSSGDHGCDTREERWTFDEWINWDWGLGTIN